MTTRKQDDNQILDAINALESRINARIDEQNHQITSMKNQQSEIHDAIVGSLDGARRGLLRRVEQLEYVVGIFVSGIVIIVGIIGAYIKTFLSGGKT